MNHLMLDCYGANPILLNDVMYINDLMNEIIARLALKAIMPPSLIPYYYGKIKEDSGISSFSLLEGSHITIHTFPLRKCYFVDLFLEEEVDPSQLENILQEKLAYVKELSLTAVKDRRQNRFENHPYNEKLDFGPHILLSLNVKDLINMESIYDFLESLVKDVNMTPIIRPLVLKNKTKNPRYLSGIIMIAESHISLHYNLETKTIKADVFSCVPFEYNRLPKIFSVFGELNSFEVIARGTKHYRIIEQFKALDLQLSSEKWKHYIED